MVDDLSNFDARNALEFLLHYMGQDTRERLALERPGIYARLCARHGTRLQVAWGGRVYDAATHAQLTRELTSELPFADVVYPVAVSK